MRTKLQFSAVLLGSFCLILGAASMATAAAGGYVPGVEGVMAASVPPPGVHYRQYNVLYEADTLTDKNGDEIDIGFDISVFANVHRLVWITNKKLLGADYGASVIVPVTAIDLEIGAFGVKDSNIGVGDILIEPFVLAWHGERYDVALGLGVNLPTGDFDENEPASVGSGCLSGLLTFGGTVYFDAAKSWSVSALTRSLAYGKQKDTDLKPGSEFFVDWGIGKQLPLSPSFLIRPGIAGYAYWQVGKDSGPGSNDDKGQVYAVGPEVNLFWLPPHLFQANMRFLWEFGAEDEAEGTKAVLTLTKSF